MHERCFAENGHFIAENGQKNTGFCLFASPYICKNDTGGSSVYLLPPPMRVLFTLFLHLFSVSNTILFGSQSLHVTPLLLEDIIYTLKQINVSMKEFLFVNEPRSFFHLAIIVNELRSQSLETYGTLLSTDKVFVLNTPFHKFNFKVIVPS